MNFYESIVTGGYNPNGVLFCFILWVIMLVIARPVRTFLIPTQNNTSLYVALFSILFIIVCTFGLHRWDVYHVDDIVLKDYSHLEPTHVWIFTKLAHLNLFVYKILVFGTSAALMFYIAKRLNVYSLNFCLVCALFLVDSMFCEMRGTLGHTILLLGYVLIIDNRPGKRGFINIVFGVTFLVLAYFLHRSIFICYLFVLLSLIKFNKKIVIIISWILFPFLVKIGNNYFGGILNFLTTFEYGGDMGTVESIMLYGESDFSFGKYNIVGSIVRFVGNLATYFTFIYLTYKICFQQIKLDRIYVYLFRFYYACIYVGWLLTSMDVNAWLGSRISVMALYPMPFVLTKVWGLEKKSTVWTKLIIVFGIIGCALSLLLRYRDWSAL